MRVPTPPATDRPHTPRLHPSWHWTRRSLPLPPAPTTPDRRIDPAIAMSLIRRQPDGTLCWIDLPATPGVPTSDAPCSSRPQTKPPAPAVTRR